MNTSHHLHTAMASDTTSRRIAAAQAASIAREARTPRTRPTADAVTTARPSRPGLRRFIPARPAS